MTRRQEILGRGIFEVFPDNPDDPAATGVSNLSASLERVLRNKAPDAMAVQKYDIRRPDAEGGGFEERYWSPVNSPVFGPGGGVAHVIHRVEDVTEFLRLQQRGLAQEKQAQEMRVRGERMEAEIFLRAQELQEANRRLRQANEELARMKAELERRVEERTADLTRTNAALRAEERERTRAERERASHATAAERRRRLYEAALSNTPDLVFIFGLDHRFVYANESLLAMWGRTWDEAVGKNCLELGYEPWHAAMHDREIEQVVATKQPVKGEVPFTGTSGRRVYEYIFVPVLSEGGEVEAVAGTTRDVTDPPACRGGPPGGPPGAGGTGRRADRRAAPGQRILEGPAGERPDRRGRLRRGGGADAVQRRNPRLHGMPEEPIPSDQWAECYRLYRPDGETPMPRDELPLYRALRGERVRDAEMVIAPDDAPPKTVLTSGQAFYDAEGVKLGAVVSMQDITARKRAEAALRQARDELERRVANAPSNWPAATMRCGTPTVARTSSWRRWPTSCATRSPRSATPCKSSRCLGSTRRRPSGSREMMERQVHHLVRLVDDLLDVSRIMRGKIDLRREPVELAAVVARAVETAQPLLDAAAARVDGRACRPSRCRSTPTRSGWRRSSATS